MSKKKNKKFKKSSPATKSQLIENVQQNAQNLAVDEVQTSVQPEKPSVSAKASLDEKDEYDVALLNEKYQPIRRDVFKLLIVIACLAIVLIAIYFVGAKTTILNTVGDWLYKISGIQTQ